MKKIVLALCLALVCCGAKKPEVERHDVTQGRTDKEILAKALDLAEDRLAHPQCRQAFKNWSKKHGYEKPKNIAKDFHNRIAFSNSEFIPPNPFAAGATLCSNRNVVMLSMFWLRTNGERFTAKVIVHEYSHTLQCESWWELVESGTEAKELIRVNAEQELHAQEVTDACFQSSIMKPYDESLEHPRGPQLLSDRNY